MTKWEYKTDTLGHFPGGSELSFYGEKGWELVSVTVIRGLFGGDCVCVFKRPLTEEPKKLNDEERRRLVEWFTTLNLTEPKPEE